jgi:hypothetical protein
MPRILRRWRLHNNSRCGWRGNMDRDQMRRCSFAMLIRSRLSTPSKDQAPRDPMLASNLRYFRARRKRLLDDPRFLIVRPTPPALEAVQNLNPHRPRDLKYVLKVASFADLHEQTRRSSPEANCTSMIGGSGTVFAHQRRQYLRRHQTFSMPTSSADTRWSRGATAGSALAAPTAAAKISTDISTDVTNDRRSIPLSPTVNE